MQVSEGDWARFLDEIAPMPSGQGRGQTIAQSKREGLTSPVGPRHARGAVARHRMGRMQAVNTYTHHEGDMRGMARSERNMLRAVQGGTEALDRDTTERILAIAG